MKNLKNKFIFFIILFIAIIIGVQVFLSPGAARDTNSYFTLIEGRAELNKQPVELERKYQLTLADEVETKEQSLGVIEWGDGSVTRLSSNTKVVIKEANVTADRSQINIAFELMSGKSWSKVTSFLGERSYFNQYIDDLEAGVRGTTFEVNKDAEYIAVVDHSVNLKNNSGFSLELSENQAFSLSSLTLVDIQKFLQEIQDKTWNDLNKSMDSQLVLRLKEAYLNVQTGKLYDDLLAYFMDKYSVLKDVKEGTSYSEVKADIDEMSPEDKKSLYDELKQMYQQVSFAGVQDEEAYKQKVYLRKLLLSLSGSKVEQETMVRSSAYDVQDMIETKNYTYFVDVLGDIKGKEQMLGALGVNHKDIFKLDAAIPTDVIQTMKDTLGDMSSLFDANTFLNADGSFKDAIEKANKAGQDAINNALNSVTNTIQ